MALALVCLALSPGTARAQGDGPRAWLLAPDGLNAVSFTWMELSSNYNFAGDILIPGADLDSDVKALTFIHYFGLAGRFAQVQATGIFGGVGGTVELGPGSPLPNFPPGVYQTRRFRGFGDPVFTFRVGLAGAPALKLPEFAKHRQGVQLYAMVSAAPPLGEYNTTQLVNLGTNRWSIRTGPVMVVPFRTGATPTLLEIIPTINFYTTNQDVVGGAVERSQDPVFVTESHLTHNLTTKFWVGGDLRYQYGGATTTDGIQDDNRTNALGAGVTVGYQILRPLAVFTGWSKVIAEDDGSRGTMWRVRMALVF
jgi:hypothetical protein